MTPRRKTRRSLLLTISLLGLFGLGAPAMAAGHSSAPKLSAHLSVTKAITGSVVKVSGAITPKAKVTVSLQRLSKGKWSTLSHQKTTAAGTYSFKIRAKAPVAVWALRITAAGPTGTPTQSATLHLRVAAKPIAKIPTTPTPTPTVTPTTIPTTAPTTASTLVTGLVSWPDGTVAANASLLLFPYNNNGFGYRSDSVSVSTDATGHFSTSACPCPLLMAYYDLSNPGLTSEPAPQPSTGQCTLTLQVVGASDWQPASVAPGGVINYRITPMECTISYVVSTAMPDIVTIFDGASTYLDAERISKGG
jgi:hypothetical protein